MVKMAIIGAGSIAIKMAQTIAGMDTVEAYAIASRDINKAESFKNEHGLKKAYGSYAEMLTDENVDLVYIAVPHTLHYECTKMCLEAGKNVLCEKPFCANAQQAEEIIKMAEEKNLLLTEAIWTRYMPSRKMIDDVLASGEIGEVTSLTANLGYNLHGVKRLWDPHLAGGALLDISVYLINFARMVFGEVDAEITSTARFENGVDMIDSIAMTFPDGKVATMQGNVAAAMNRTGCIFGTKGYVEVTNINNPQEIRIFNTNYEEVRCIKVPEQITGYEYEVAACVKALEEGKIECPEISHDETLNVMKIMDSIRSVWGYKIQGLEE